MIEQRNISEYTIGSVIYFETHWPEIRFGVVISKEEYDNYCKRLDFGDLFEPLKNAIYIKFADGECKEIMFQSFSRNPKIVLNLEEITSFDPEIKIPENVKRFLQVNFRNNKS